MHDGSDKVRANCASKEHGVFTQSGNRLLLRAHCTIGAVFTANQFTHVTQIASRFGNGKVAFTSRLTAEIVGIPYDRIAELVAYAKEHGLRFGGTGAKIRPITACKGTICVFGNCDTQALAAQLDAAFYEGWTDVALPHKFKIAIGGCSNSSMKPSLNDFGIEGHLRPVLQADKCRACKTCQV